MKKVLLGLAIACVGFSATSQAQTIMSQNFSGSAFPAMPTGWTNVHTGTGNGWETANTSISLYFGSVPISAPHATYAIVNEYGHPKNTPATMTSPVFSLVGTPNAYLSYDEYFFGAYTNGVDTSEVGWVDISTNGGTSWTTIDTLKPNGAWATRYVPLGTYAGSANCKLRFQYTDNSATLIGAAVTNILVYTPAANDLDLTAVYPNPNQPNNYSASGSTATFTGTVFNNGYSPVTTFTYSYQQGALPAVAYTFTGLSIAPFTSYNFTDPTGYVLPATLGNYPFKTWVTLGGDANHTNDSMTTSLNSVSFMPTKRIMFEEPTGSWCGWCVRGIVYMDSLWSTHSANVSIVSVHDFYTYDPMATENALTTSYDAFIKTIPGFSGFPGLVVDRHFSTDPSNAFVYYSGMSSYFGFADMTVAATYSGSNINVTGTVKPALNLTGDYRVELVLTEDKVHGTAAGYAQHDYYSFQSQNLPLSGEGYNFQDSTQVINASSMYYKFVDRYTVPDLGVSPNGVASSLPATMTTGTTYNYSFTPVAIASDWVATNMRAVVMLIDNNASSATYKQVLNSVNVPVTHNVGVANVAAGIDALSIYPNPAKEQAHVVFQLLDAGKVHFSVTDVLGREVLNVPAEEMTAGGQQINFSTANFPSGSYNVSLTTANGTITQHLSVVR